MNPPIIKFLAMRRWRAMLAFADRNPLPRPRIDYDILGWKILGVEPIGPGVPMRYLDRSRLRLAYDPAIIRFLAARKKAS